jgi:dihydroneopterin aldolase
MSNGLPSRSDVVFVDTLCLSADIGPDCWGRVRPQPIEITVYLHLKPAFLHAAGESDDVVDSVHYGHLTKAISALIESKYANDSSGFKGTDDLIRAVTACAFELAGEAALEVRVVLGIPKMILLASGFTVDVVAEKIGSAFAVVSKKISVEEIVVPMIIGVNPPEREEKQRVLVHITFHEDPSFSKNIDYSRIISKLFKASKSLPLL